MSRVSGEKARAAIQKRNRTIRRAKDRASLAQLKAGAGGATATEKAPTTAKSRKASGGSPE